MIELAGRSVPLNSTLSLLAYILLIAPAMIAGFVFARRKMFEPQHKYTMTFITLFNWVLIALLMALNYRGAVEAGSPPSTLLVPTVHLGFGAVAQLLATYLVIRMWFENQLPAALKIRRIKPVMRLTLALWTITVLLGITTYVTWYLAPVSAAADAPLATPEVTSEAPVETPEADSTAEPVQTPETSANPVGTPETSIDPVVTPETGAAGGIVAPVVTPEVRDDSGGDDDDSGGSDNSGRGSDDSGGDQDDDDSG